MTDSRKLSSASGGVIVRNTFLNMAGRCIPLAAALIAIPLLVQGLGTERYGLLALFWIILGYFSFLDFGIGRATTKFLVDGLARNDLDALPPLIWTSWALLMGLGVLAGLILAALVPVLTDHIFNVPAYLREETIASLYWLAGFLPFAFGIAGMQGVLEARQRFDIINAIQIPSRIMGYLVPLLVLLYTRDLSVVTVALLVSQAVVWGLYVTLCLHTMPSLRRLPHISCQYLKDLLRFGGWLTVSNIIGPIMVQMDRFLIGALATLSAVTYYTTPYSVVTQLSIIPGSLMPVLFPAFSGLTTQRNPAIAPLYRRAVKYIFLAMAPVVIVFMVLADDLMTLWLGAEFASHSAPVLALLALGVLINSLAQVPYGLIQAAGRPDVTARFHILEVLPYFALVWWGIATYGIVGAAFAWVMRAAADAALLFWFADRLLPQTERGFSFVAVFLPITAGLYGVTALATGMVADTMMRGLTVLGILTLASASVWRLWFSPEEKAALGYCRLWVLRQRL